MKRFFQRMLNAVKGFGFKQWFLLILNVLLVGGSIGCLLGLGAISSTLDTLTAAGRFQGQGDIRFAQLACYLPVDDGKSENDIRSFRQTLEDQLVAQSLEAPEGGRLYLDAYSGAAQVTVSSDNGGNASVKAIGVGGDFFYFHPLRLRSGAYIKSDDLMDDLVVLDEEMAWRLFGGTDLAGLTMYINGQPFVVSGVVAREADFATGEAYTGDGGVFMSFSALSRLQESADITAYEIVMPNPITNFAKGILEDTFPVGDGDVVENSSRYSLPHLWEVIKGFGQRSMRTNGVIYPYWENAARMTEDYAAMLLVLAVLLAVYPLLTVLVLIIRDIRRAYRFAKAKIPEKVDEAVEKRREERLEKKFEKKEKEGKPDGGSEPS
ncbi:MAG: ABC transporter permease [Oscillospiraceae bacterium]|nr:ABC transporter permease [Oscillospiraceae bacterium]